VYAWIIINSLVYYYINIIGYYTNVIIIRNWNANAAECTLPSTVIYAIQIFVWCCFMQVKWAADAALCCRCDTFCAALRSIQKDSIHSHSYEHSFHSFTIRICFVLQLRLSCSCSMMQVLNDKPSLTHNRLYLVMYVGELFFYAVLTVFKSNRGINYGVARMCFFVY
jgi:hypothetical protein